jgi:hypothetical protein
MARARGSTSHALPDCNDSPKFTVISSGYGLFLLDRGKTRLLA